MYASYVPNVLNQAISYHKKIQEAQKKSVFSCQASKEQEASRRAESFNDFFSAEEASSTAVAPKATPPSDSICVHGFFMKVNNDCVFTCVLHVFYMCFICVLYVFYMCFSCSFN